MIALLSGAGYPDFIVIEETMHWMGNNIDYEYHYHVQPTIVFTSSNRGDCTDTALYAQRMLHAYQLDVNVVHGYAVCYGQKVKHDFIEYNGSYYDVPQWGCVDLEYVGDGVW